MKERIVLDFGAELKNICNGCAEGVESKCPQTEEKIKECVLYTSRFDEYRVEQVPETFEELKELCKKEDISAENEEIIIRSHNDTWLTFREQDGEVFLESETGLSILLGYKRTPQQMWQIIKSLIGEE